MNPKKLVEHLDKVPQIALVQGWVPMSLRKKVAEQMKLDRREDKTVTWNSFLEAACKAYLDGRKR